MDGYGSPDSAVVTAMGVVVVVAADVVSADVVMSVLVVPTVVLIVPVNGCLK